MLSARAQHTTPHVSRTFTHHQVLADPSGASNLAPVVSDSGDTIVFGLRPVSEPGPARLGAIDFEGGPLTVLDAGDDVRLPDVTANGKRAVYVVGNQIRTTLTRGGDIKVLLEFASGSPASLKVSGNGRVVVFHTRGFVARVGDRLQEHGRGVYALDIDGGSPRLVVGPDEVAQLRGIPVHEAGSPNFTLQHAAGSLDISTDGQRIAFGCWAAHTSCIFGCDLYGRDLHTIAELPNAPGGIHQFNALALSGDGSTVAWCAWYPSSAGRVGFDGRDRRALVEAGPNDGGLHWLGGEPIHVTLDGSLVTYIGRVFRADGTGFVQLMRTHQDDLLRYLEYEVAAPDAFARRFAYWPYSGRPYQLATMELNVPWDRLRGAPRVTEIVVDPAAIPRASQEFEVFETLVAARVTTDAGRPHVSSTAFFQELQDPKIRQFGLVGRTDQLDDGAAATSGDAVASDGVYSRRWLSAYADAPDGPRALRIEAQVVLPSGLRAAQVVEVRPFELVAGSAQRPPGGPPPAIDGTPPPPPPIQPLPSPGDVAGGGDGAGNGGGAGDASGGSGGTAPGAGAGGGPTDGPGAVGAGPGAIDLTGYWVTEDGALHFVRQLGADVYWSVAALPRVRNVYVGKLAAGVVTGTWVDLPGGMIETGTGTLQLEVESNDRMTKVFDSPAYGAAVWIRVAAPPGAGGSAPGSGPGTDPGLTSGALEAWRTTEGRQLIDQWAAEAALRLNRHSGSAAFQAGKPYRFNEYGLLAGKGLGSTSAPDDYKTFGNDRHRYMWHVWVPDVGGWRYPEWNAAGVPALHDYVNKRLVK